jgi:two-component system OmpR family sensor kinase
MSLRSRLLLSYLAIVAVFMGVISLVLLLLASGLSRNVAYQQLSAVAETSLALILRAQRLNADLPQEGLRGSFERIAESRDVRLLLATAGGEILLDSGGPQARWNILELASYQPTAAGIRGSWRDNEGQSWLFVGRHLLPDQGTTLRGRLWLLFATAEPDRRGWFRQNLVRPLLWAGGIGLLLAAVLAWWISRSVARPLQRVAGAAHAIAQGDYDQTVPVSGPSEVRHVAQDFNRMAQQVRSARDAQRDFVANVSHELKTPLTSIQGYAQAIVDGTAGDPETIQRSAGVIHDEADRMARMVSELLDLARIESGQVVMERAAVDLGGLLKNVVERFQLRAQEQGVTLSARIADLPPVTGDGDRLVQVFTNLLDNALKHTPAGGKVTVTAQQLTPSGMRKRGGAWPRGVEVAVSDSGQGIPPQDLSRVFERFYQVDKSRRHTGSVGLGLAISREIVQAHGGSIKAESIVGLGTRFTVVLPVRPGG